MLSTVVVASFVTESAGVNPLMVIEADRSGRLELVGIAGENVALASVGIAGELTVIPIERQRAARLGATRAFRFFSLTVDRRALCADRRIAEIAIPASTRLLSAADRVPYARSLETLCEDEPVGLGSLLRWLLRALI